MYRALYEYKAPLPDYLSFRAGDQFTIIEKANKDWFRAQNGLGQIGLVPCIYVKPVQVNADEVLKFVDWSIEAIHLQATGEGAGQYTHEQRATLQKLVKHRSDLAKQLQSKAPLARSQSEDINRQSERRRAPPPPVHAEVTRQLSTKETPAPPPPSDTGGDPQNSANLPDVVHSTPNHAAVQQVPEEHTAPDSSDNPHLEPVPETELPSAKTNNISSDQQAEEIKELPPVTNHSESSQPTQENNLSSAPAPDSCSTGAPAAVGDVQEVLKTVEVPDKIGPELLEEVRKNTGLSFEKSKIAVETVLGYVGFKMPALEGLMDKVLASLHFGRDISDEDVTSHDAQRLSVIFSELTACKDDSQQRSWALHEDEAIIQEYLQELLSILENAKPSICRKVVCRDNYEILHSLVQYYQMETREVLCSLLLKVFGALCGLEKEVIANLLYSVLPLELGQELTTHTEDVQRVCYTALVMTMIFSTGDNVSTAVTDKLTEEFFLHILQLIENPPSAQFEDDAVDLLISFVLAFNLHLTAVDTNIVLRSLAAFGTPKVFTEHIMLLINRGDDPVKMFEFKPQPPNSVLKLFHDLYSDLTTADLLYTNDAKVLMDVIVGRLSNLSPGDKVRSSFLVLCQKVVQNSSYSDHCHRVRELQLCLQAICKEEADTPDDKQVAQSILNSHPVIFTN